MAYKQLTFDHALYKKTWLIKCKLFEIQIKNNKNINGIKS